MSSEKLMNAIGLLDDDLILDAEKKPEKKSHAIYIKYTAVAASLLLLVLAAFLMRNAFNEPGGEPENTLLAESESTKVPYTAEPEITNEPVLPSETITTKAPVSEELVADRNTDSSGEEVVYNDVKTPESIVTVEPVTTSPVESTKEPVELKPSEDHGSSENESNDENPLPVEPPVTEVPVVTETPEEDTTWTEEFVVSNVKDNEGVDKTVAFGFVEQLYFSSISDIPSFKTEKESSWWYGVKLGDFLYSQAEVNIPDDCISTLIGESVLKGVNRTDYTTKQTKAYAYVISGVAIEAAVAVKIDEQEGYYLFVNTDFRAVSLNEFVQAYNLEEYAEMNTLAVYADKVPMVTENITSSSIWNILTFGESKYVDYKQLYYEHEVTATIEMDAKLYGYADVPVALYDEGYVVVFLGDINGAYYVGPEKIALVKGLVTR